jgi:hypothetical protein
METKTKYEKWALIAGWAVALSWVFYSNSAVYKVA